MRKRAPLCTLPLFGFLALRGWLETLQCYLEPEGDRASWVSDVTYKALRDLATRLPLTPWCLGEQWSSPKSPCSSSAATLPPAPGPWHLQLPQEDSSPMLHGPAHTVLMQSLLKHHFLRETFHKLPSLGQVCLWATLKDYDPFLHLSTLVIMHSWWNMDISQAICKKIL